MSRQQRSQWFSAQSTRKQRKAGARSAAAGNPIFRRLRYEPLEDRRLLAVFTVSNLNDAGSGSLRAAITLANADAIADTIDFSVTGTIEMASRLPTITQAVTITGPGADQLTINANNVSRIFEIDDGTASQIDVQLSGLTLTGGKVNTNSIEGRDGGAISNRENLTLSSSTLSGNMATRGGGISNYGTATVTNSTVSDNVASIHGGIWNLDGSVTVTSSTISGNKSFQSGGGITNAGGTATITSSTISGNTALGNGGGMWNRYGSVTVTSSTISGNSAEVGGGISNSDGSMTVTSSLISGNSADYGNELSGTFTLTGYNLIGDSSQTTAEALNRVSVGVTDVLATSDGTVPTALASILGPLADNGGPTWTHALVVGSPAINAGDPAFTTPPTFDQRGAPFARVGGGTIDIGAYEVQTLSLVVDTLVDESDGDYFLGDLSLREAIELANAFPGADTINFAAALSGGTILLDDLLGEMTITGAVTIDATALASGLTIDAGNGTDNIFNTGDGYRIFNIEDGTASQIDVQIRGLTLTGGDVTGFGGAIFSRENLTLTSSTLSGNSASNGGGILNYGTSTVTGSTLSGNSASFGGGISNYDTATVTGSTLSGNSAGVRGGGILNSVGGMATITSSTLSGNSANSGGGIYNFAAATIISSTLSDNMAGNDGGGIVNSTGGTATVTTSTLSGNSASVRGGGIRNFGTVTISSSTLTGNSASIDGGGIVNSSGTLTVTSSLISGNTASAGNEISEYQGTVNLNGYNLIGDSSQTTAQALSGVSVGATDITATSDGTVPTARASILDTALSDNGGPTQTHAISIASPAFDAGDPAFTTPPTFDQRGSGFPRVYGLRVDIGAFELQPLPALLVDTDVDESDGDYSVGDLSLREAIELTNVFPGADTISFAAALSGGTILLDDLLGEMTITGAVTIDATALASGLTIDAGNGTDNIFNTGDGYRIFNIDDGTASQIDVQFRGLTLTGGDIAGDGGAISNRENLTLSESVISRNSASSGGGIWNFGTVAVTNGNLLGNSASFGGGILNFGMATITSSTLSGNSASNGGAISNYGTATVTTSTLSSNSASSRGGGILNLGGTATITSSTLSGNSANSRGGGILNSGGTAIITSSTLSGNSASFDGGGIVNSSGTATLTGSLISGNTAGVGNEIRNFGGPVNLNGYNVIGDISQTTAQALSGVSVGASDIVATSDGTVPTALASILDTTLADNGGPTQTHALVARSPAFEAGNPAFTAPPNFDQRGSGFSRVAGFRVDVGAFELQSIPALLLVDTNVDESDGDYSPGDLSLREAIELANAFPGADTITFDAALASDTIPLTLGVLTISDDLTVTGPGADLLTIDAGGNSGVMRVSGATTANISGLTFSGGRTGRGAGLRNDAGATTTLTDMVISGNTATQVSFDAGGGLWNAGNLTLVRSTVAGNIASGGGGGIFNDGMATITRSTISGNSASSGGGISNFFGSATVTSSTITGNSGGGIFNYDGAGTITGSLITGNTDSIANEIRNFSYTFILNGYNLIGDSSQTTAQALSGITVGATDITATSNGTNPTALASILGPLADNGGSTLTHALLAGSPAIDMGDPTVMFDAMEYDQRGVGFLRVVDSGGGLRVDIGAYEVQVAVAVPDSADFDGDGDVDGRDFLTWQRGFGIVMPNAVKTDGDADNDLDVDGDDLDVWQLQYATVPPMLATLAVGEPVESVSLLVSTTEDPLTSYRAAIDAAMALNLFEDGGEAESVPLTESSWEQEISYDSMFADDTFLPRGGDTEAVDFGFIDSNDAEKLPEAWLTEELLEQVFG